jgi:acyl-CoA synthetase (AMP-forming)/AMP-acid ligase II
MPRSPAAAEDTARSTRSGSFVMPQQCGFDVAAIFRRAARHNRAGMAIRWEDGARSYGELAARVEALAAAFAAEGVEPGDRIAILTLNGPSFIEAYLATQQLGSVTVPINFRLSAPEIDERLVDASPSLLVTDRHSLDLATTLRLPERCRLVADAPSPGALDYEGLIAAGRDHEAPRPPIDLAAPATILYTSGTTGAAKGVVRSQLALSMIIALRQAAMFIGPQTVLLATTPMFHAAGHEFMLLQTLAAGGCIVSRRSFDPEEIAAIVPRDGITHAFFVPTMAARLMDVMEARQIPWPSLKLWCSAAAPLATALRDRILAALPECELWNVYGATEAGVVSYLRAADIRRKPGTCVGLPFTGADVRCVDDKGKDLPEGAVGEIVCRSPEAMLGYWNRPEASAAAMMGGWIHTGDLGTFDADGFLHVLDRAKDMVISGGENIYAAEVENAIASQLGVADVAVIGAPHPTWGEAVVAVVVGRSAALTEDAVLDHARRQLARYKCPKRVVFVPELGRNSYGKVVKDALRKRYANLFQSAT